MKCNKYDIDVVEGTTHQIKFSCSSECKPYYFDDYRIVFAIVDNGEIKRKEATAKENIITAKLDPSDTLGKYGRRLYYECRAFSKTNEVFHIALGDINVIKAKAPIIRYEVD